MNEYRVIGSQGIQLVQKGFGRANEVVFGAEIQP